MSGLEVAGVVLGALPIVVEAISTYRAQKGLIATMRRSGGLVDKLIHQLKVQQACFYFDILELLREARVHEILREGDPPIAKCVEILQAVSTGDEVKHYLGSQIFDDFLDILRYWEHYLKEITSKLGHIVRPHNATKDDLWAVIQARKCPDASLLFKGKLKFTIDREGLDTLLKNLQAEEGSLQKLLRRVKTKREWEAREPTRSSATMTLAFSRVQDSAASLHWAASECWVCAQHPRHHLLMQLEDRIPNEKSRGPSPSAVAFRLCFPIEETMLQRIEVNAQGNTSSITKGSIVKFDNSTSSAVSKTNLQVPSITLTEVPNAAHRFAARVRINSICEGARQAREKGKEVLSLILTSGASLEVVEKDHDSPHTYARSISLADFLEDAAAEVDVRMSPVQQTHLALKVVSAVLQLRLTNWCSTPWTSTTIRFPVRAATGASAVLFTPYIEQALDPSLLKTSRRTSTDLTTGEAKATMLNLAILLLEILHHQTIAAWAAQHDEGEPGTYQARFLTAMRWLELSQSRLLPQHLRPVEQCLVLCARSKVSWDDSFQRLFYENIIKPLHQLVL